jgi:predicted Zn-dependent peptidase
MLFRNVREKMSLCYYCSSRFERVKGVLTVDSGVDVANVERAKEEILRQLDAIARGEFSDEDLEASRRYVINQLRDHDNLQSGIGSWYMGQALCLPFRTVEDTVDMMRTVTREEITALAKTVTLTAVYTVLPEEETV